MAYPCRPRLCSQGGSGLNSATVCLKPGPAQFSLRAPSQIVSHEFLPHQAWCPCSGRRQSVHWPGWHKGFFQALYLGPTVSEKIAWSCSGLHPQLFQRRPPRVAGQDQSGAYLKKAVTSLEILNQGQLSSLRCTPMLLLVLDLLQVFAKTGWVWSYTGLGIWPGHPSICPRIGYCPLLRTMMAALHSTDSTELRLVLQEVDLKKVAGWGPER